MREYEWNDGDDVGVRAHLNLQVERATTCKCTHIGIGFSLPNEQNKILSTCNTILIYAFCLPQHMLPGTTPTIALTTTIPLT